jgi:hypothetical protein
VQFSKAGLWTIASGQTVTFASPITETDASSHIFAGSGTVAFTASTQTHAPVEWWGAVADWNGTTGTDNTTAIQACLTAHPVQCDILYGAYKTTAALSITSSNVGIHGAVMQFPSLGGSMLVQTSASADILDIAGTNSTSGRLYNNYLDHFAMTRSTAGTTSSKGLSMSYTNGAEVAWVLSQESGENFYFLNFQNSVMHDCWAQWLLSYSSGNYYGVYVDGAVNAQSMHLFRDTVIGGAQGGTVAYYGLYETGANMNDLFTDWFEVSNANYGIAIDGTSATGHISGFDIHFQNSILDGMYTSCAKVSNMAAAANSTVQFVGGQCSLQTSAPSGTAKAFDIESSVGVQVTNMQFAQGFAFSTNGWLAAIYANGSSSLDLSGNTFNPVFGVSAIVLNNTNYSSVTHNSVVMTGGIVSSVLVNLTGTASNNTIASNNLTGSGATSTGILFGASAASNFARDNVVTGTTALITDSNGTNSWNTAANTVIQGAIKAVNLAGTGTRPTCADSSGNLSGPASIACATQAADTVVMNATGSTAAPTAVAMPTCTTGANLYNTTTHAWSCVSTGGGSGALTQIAQSVAAGSTAFVTFSSISGYTNVYIKAVLRTASGATDLKVQFNSDTGSNYDFSSQYIGSGGTVSNYSGPSTAQTSGMVCAPAFSTSPANLASQCTMRLNGYAGTTFYKQWEGESTRNLAGGDSTNIRMISQGDWRNTGAITSIKLFTADGSNFVAGSTFTIYGEQ